MAAKALKPHTYSEIRKWSTKKRKDYMLSLIETYNPTNAMLCDLLYCGKTTLQVVLLNEIGLTNYAGNPTAKQRKDFAKLINAFKDRMPDPECLYEEVMTLARLNTRPIGQPDRSSPIEYIRSKLMILIDEFCVPVTFDDVKFFCEHMTDMKAIDMKSERIIKRGWGIE